MLRGRRLLGSWWLPVALLAVPFVVAAVRLWTRHWTPVLDMAMTELRVRDVGGRHTPLIGLPGRIGNFPDQGSHPGPLSFLLVAPLYRLFGSSAWAMLAATCVLAVTVLAAVLAVGRRLGGPLLRLAMVAVAFVLVQGYGLGVLSQPWNPYFPLLFWLLTFAGAWAVLAGEERALWLVVLAGCVCAQTHISYLLLVTATVMLALAVVVVRAVREPPTRGVRLRRLAVAVGVGVVVWVPPLIDEIRHRPGNISMLRAYFESPDEGVIGLGRGAAVLLRNLDLTHFVFGRVGSTVGGDLPNSVWPGALLVALWAASAVAAVLVVRLRQRRILALHAVVALGLLAGWVSTSRIFGKVWFYLTLWSWTIAVFAAVATLWMAVELARPALDARRMTRLRASLGAALTGVIVACAVSLVVRGAVQQAPEQRLSDSLRAVVAPTVRALDDGVGGATGRNGRYTVLWDDAYLFGSQGYGLVNELERHGFTAGSPSTWHVPLTPHRVIEVADATTVVQFATGSYIQKWKDNPAATLVVEVDLRTSAQRAEFARLRDDLVGGLQARGLDELLPLIDVNLFGVQLDPRVPADLQRTVNRMIDLGEPTAVFLLHPDAVGSAPAAP